MQNLVNYVLYTHGKAGKKSLQKFTPAWGNEKQFKISLQKVSYSYPTRFHSPFRMIELLFIYDLF